MIGSLLLLLAEDEPIVLVAAQDALEEGGYSVVSAHTGLEAAELLDGHIDELAGLITDVRLGDGPDGWELARRARTAKPALPIVYTTTDRASEWPVYGVPNSLLVQKPYAPAQLLSAISTLLTKVDSTVSPNG